MRTRISWSKPALMACLAGLATGLVWAPVNGTSLDVPGSTQKNLRWWRKARFGMFIHWGPVTLKGTEIGWSRGAQVPIAVYDNLYHHFDPTNFNANTWVHIAKEAGMKYLIITSKHHDGFCLWNTKYTDYNIMHTPFHRDVVKELSEACRRQGIVFGAYYSILDWHNPDYPMGSPGGKTRKSSPNMDRYNQYLKNQIAELIHNYGPLGVLWFDGDWESPWTPKRGEDLYRYCRTLQPSLLVNNRVSKSFPDGGPVGDFDTPEQHVGQFQTNRAWESCITIGRQWAWKPHDQIKSLKQCVQILVRTAGGDGNLLLNVGPRPDGTIEPRQVERLMEIGRWLKANGRSIYGTRGGPFKPASWGVCTHKGNTIFLHVLDWKGGDAISLPDLHRQIRHTSILGGGQVAVKRTSSGVSLQVPQADHRPIDTIIVLRLAAASVVSPK